MAGINHAVATDLASLMAAGECGMGGGAVNCIDVAQNPECEGSVPCRH